MFNSDQKRAFVAVLLSGVVLFGWQYYFTSKMPANKEVKVAEQPAVATETKAEVAATVTNTISPNVNAPATLVENKLVSNKNEFTFTNDLSFSNAANDVSLFNLQYLTGVNKSFKIQVLTDNGPTDVLFENQTVEANKLVAINSIYGIQFSADIDDKGKLNYALKSEKPYKYKLIFDGKEKKDSNGQIRHFMTYSKDVKFVPVGDDNDYDGNFRWLGVDYNYHMFTISFKAQQTAKVVTTEKGQMIVDLTNANKDLSGSIVFTKKNYDHLIAISSEGENLHLAVDFGFFAILAVPTLRALQFIYKYIPNYGIAIVLLTIFLRLITFPLQYKSFKSMKKMQQIQPELLKIKEKYKDDSQKMQKETMALFQKAGANPLSGCLPLLLQMPFFFAIYRVLYSAVELVGAPFFGWIHDLSIHDPFYLLPVLMAGSMFLQQKLTPQTSMDPTQQKIMLFMPLIFGFIMKDLPAGLVLYIFVSTMVGILQQYVVYKAID
jgi:YidC/Oxa1 family membrane protein insertase